MLETLSLREWSRTDITADALWTLALDESLSPLVCNAIVQLVHEKQGSGIRAFGFVGRCLAGRRQITVSPRLSCDYGALVDELDILQSRIVRDALGMVGEGSQPVALIEAMVDATERYLRIGRVARYATSTEETAFPRGHILRSETIRARARGRHDIVVVRRRTLRVPSLAETALRLALTKCDESLQDRPSGAERSLLVAVRAVIRLLPAATPIPLALLLAAADDARHAAPPYVRDVFALARLLLGGGADTMAALPIVAVHGGIFIDMAAVVEHAARRAIGRLLPNYTVLDGNVHKQPFLAAPLQRAEPDIVIRSSKAAVGLIDVKDKLVTSPERDDIYQLFSHCAGAGAAFGLLLYIGQVYGPVRSIGVWNGTISLFYASVRPNYFAEDIRSVLTDIGLSG